MAVLLLQASAFEMGVLRAVGAVPVLLLGLFVGVWVDRLRRRPILIVTSIGRALLLGAIPAAAFLGLLRMEVLYAVVFLVGMLGVFFDVAITSYLPALVRREDLVEGNSKLQLSHSAGGIVGPGFAGWLVELIGAPLVILIRSVSLLVSAALLGLIRTPEPAPPARAQRQDVWREIGDGVRFLSGQPVLRAMVAATGIGSLGFNIQQAVLVLYVVQEVGVTSALLGIIAASNGSDRECLI